MFHVKHQDQVGAAPALRHPARVRTAAGYCPVRRTAERIAPGSSRHRAAPRHALSVEPAAAPFVFRGKTTGKRSGANARLRPVCQPRTAFRALSMDLQSSPFSPTWGLRGLGFTFGHEPAYRPARAVQDAPAPAQIEGGTEARLMAWASRSKPALALVKRGAIMRRRCASTPRLSSTWWRHGPHLTGRTKWD